MRLRSRIAAVLLAGAIALLGAWAPAQASTSAHASGGDEPAGKNCVEAEEARAGGAGTDDQGDAPTFTNAFFKRVFTFDASLDGADGSELPVSIDTVCDIPRALAKQAAQLAGGDGVALLRTSTRVYEGSTRLQGKRAATAIDGADTATLTVRLVRPRFWREDEDGNQIPTFAALRIKITD